MFKISLGLKKEKYAQAICAGNSKYFQSFKEEQSKFKIKK